MDGAVKDLRRLRIGGQPLRDRPGPEVQPAARRVRPAVQERHRRHVNLIRHHERHGLARFQRDLYRLPWRIARRHDVHRMGYGVMHLHHQLAEAAVDPIPNRLDRPDVCHRTAPNFFAGPWIMIGRADRLRDDGPEPTMRPGRGSERMVVPEHRPDIGINPEPLPDELHGHNVICRVIVPERPREGNRITLDLLDPSNLVPLHIICADQNLRIHMVLSRILHRDTAGALLRGSGQRRVHR